MGLEPLLKDPPAGQAALPLPQLASQVLQSGQAQFVQAAEDVNQASQVRSRIRPELLPASVRPLYLK